MNFCPNCGFNLENKETLIKYKVIERDENLKNIPKRKSSFDKFRDFATEWSKTHYK